MRKSLLLLLLSVALLPELFAQDRIPTLEVYGTTEFKEIPEEIVFSATLLVEDPEYLGCSSRITTTLGKVLQDLNKNGIGEDLVRTSDFQVSENLKYRNNETVKEGYKGSVRLSIASAYSTDLVDKVLQTMNAHRLVYSIDFRLSEAQKEKLTALAIEGAVKDAVKKAGLLAGASGVTLKGIQKVSYGERTFPRGELVFAEEVMTGARAMNTLRLSPSPVSITESVLIVYAIGQ